MKKTLVLIFTYICTIILLTLTTFDPEENIMRDYGQEILPPSPSFLPLIAKVFTNLRQHIYQSI